MELINFSMDEQLNCYTNCPYKNTHNNRVIKVGSGLCDICDCNKGTDSIKCIVKCNWEDEE